METISMSIYQLIILISFCIILGFAIAGIIYSNVELRGDDF